MSTTKYKMRKRAQRAVPLAGKKCANCGSARNLQRHHANERTAKRARILCQKCHAKLHVKRGDWAWMGKR